MHSHRLQTANLVVNDTYKHHTCAVAEPILGVEVPHKSQRRTGTENQLVGRQALWLKTVEHLCWVAVTVPRLDRAVGAEQHHLLSWKPVHHEGVDIVSDLVCWRQDCPLLHVALLHVPLLKVGVDLVAEFLQVPLVVGLVHLDAHLLRKLDGVFRGLPDNRQSTIAKSDRPVVKLCQLAVVGVGQHTHVLAQLPHLDIFPQVRSGDGVRHSGGTAGSRDDGKALPVRTIRIEILRNDRKYDKCLEFVDLKSPQKMTILPPQGRVEPVMSLSVASNLSKFLLSINVASSTTKSLDLLRSLLKSLWALMEKQPSSVGSKLTCSSCYRN